MASRGGMGEGRGGRRAALEPEMRECRDERQGVDKAVQENDQEKVLGRAQMTPRKTPTGESTATA